MSNNSETHYKELSLFTNIKSPGHRAWNRLMTVANLKDQDRANDAVGYIEKLPDVDQAAMALMAQKIAKKGLETVRAELNRGLETDETINNS